MVVIVVEVLKKCMMFTDIHLGRKNNSEVHNNDCIDYIDWLISQVELDSDIDHIVFLGDFFQTRSAIDISTIKYAHMLCGKLNRLGMPIYMLVGNHDLYHKSSREVHSPIMFEKYENFIIIDEPQIRTEIYGEPLMSPYLFKYEYDSLESLKTARVIFIHGEFNGFNVTGLHKMAAENVANPEDFSQSKFIFSGHFHQRQIGKNIIYIGNTFPFDFSDKNDNSKGVCVFDYMEDRYSFTDWEECPKFVEINLSELLPQIDNMDFDTKTSVNCLVDMELNYEQHIKIKTVVEDTYKLREFRMKEIPKLEEVLSETRVELVENLDLPLDELILTLLGQIESDSISSESLKELYRKL